MSGVQTSSGRTRICAAVLLLAVGVASSVLAAGEIIPLANVNFNQLSSPAGIVNQSASVPTGTSVTTVTAPLTSSGQHFTHWEINGDRASDPLGRALNPVSFTIFQTTWATAYYVDETADSDADGVLDWYETYFCGSITNASGTSDTDGDGFDLAAEYACDYHPSMADTIADGGVSRRRSISTRMILSTNYFTYIENSVPPVFADKNSVIAKGTVVTSAYCHGEVSGYTFGYWTVGGIRQSDSSGCALPQVRVTVTGDTVVTAHYFPAAGDADADGVYDWYEWQYCGTTNYTGNSDIDGDGLSLALEYEREHHPGVRDTLWDGGVSRRRSLATEVNLAGFIPYTIRSVPPGFTGESRSVTTGTVVTTAYLRGENAGYTFAYWTVNGARKQDWLGNPLHQVSFTVTAAVDAVAYYFPTTQDADGDGVPDWYEWSVLNTTNRNAAFDSDGDGFGLRTEYACEYSPLIANRVVDGGVSRRRSFSTALNLEIFRRVTDVLCGGMPTNFFSMYSTDVAGRDFGANSHPALGDWDGDGDLDLWVGSSGGRMSVFENRGSLVVANLVDQSTNFAGIASVWRNIPNPAPALGNWNFQSAADLVVGGNTNAVRIVSSTRAFQGPQSPAVNYSLPVNSVSAIPALADVDGDGGTDLLVLLDDGTVDFYQFRGNPNAPFTAPATAENILGTPVPDATGLSAGDVNADGLVDLLVSDRAGRVWEFHQTGALTFALRSMIFGGTFDGFAERLTIAASDFEMDGDVDLLCGFAEGGLIYLQNPEPKLTVRPPRATVMPGEAVGFEVLNSTGAVTWAFVADGSGGSLNAVSGHYTAGSESATIDIVEASDRGGIRGRAYVNIIGDAELARSGKAIVVAGRKNASDPLWPTTDYLADLAYNTLLYRGFSKDNVQYLSAVTNQDVDGNGALDDIDRVSSLGNAADTFTNWVGNAQRLFVYLVDHGGDASGAGYFRLNATEVLTASNLDLWLDNWQDRTSNDVVVVIDCCNAGSFVDELSYAGAAERVVIAACSAAEPTYFVAGGLVSFSDAFLSGVLLGLNVGESFALAREAMGAYQQALLDDNGDGVCQTEGAGRDGQVASQQFVGSSFVAGKDMPQVGHVSGNQDLHGNATALLWAGDVVSTYPIERVWCLIVPPGHAPDPANPVGDLPELNLLYDRRNGRYQATYGGFSQEGSYKVLFYAKDIWSSVSLPRQSYITQTGFIERVIISACGEAGAPRWPAINRLARLAYHTCRARWLANDAICYLSGIPSQDVDGDGTNDVDALPTLAHLGYAITNWAADADRLTVFLVGDAEGGGLHINGTEMLGAGDMDRYLDVFQQAGGEACAVLEFAGSAAWVPQLTAGAGTNRIVVASTGAGQPSCWANLGLVSFSQYFFGHVFSGYSIRESFAQARNALRRATGPLRQEAQLDDNGDGVCDDVDGAFAGRRYIGTAFMTGAEVPVLGDVTPDTFLPGADSLVLWASGVTDADGISNVWCVVTPPDYDGQSDLSQTPLAWHAERQRYESVPTVFAELGGYVCTFYAEDAQGEISNPAQCGIRTADDYEADDTAMAATAFAVGRAEPHYFHVSGDVDWVQFFAVSNFVYTIRTVHQGTNADTVLDVYVARTDGSVTNVAHADSRGVGMGQGEETVLNGPACGMHYVRVSPGRAGAWGGDSGYELRIGAEGGGRILTVIAANALHPHRSPAGAVAAVEGVGSLPFGAGNTVDFADLPPGTYRVQVTTAEGYLAKQDPGASGQVLNEGSYLYGNPKQVEVADASRRFAVFQFVPIVRAGGLVKDGWTGERIGGATLEFEAMGGATADLACEGYPWSVGGFGGQTGADGRFPTNLWLPAADWTLELAREGYSIRTLGGAITNASAGELRELGELTMTPVDANTNGLADGWERLHFGEGTNAAADADTDRDGRDNRSEYVCGTDPTNQNSVLALGEPESITTDFTLVWPVSPWRLYELLAVEHLATSVWPRVGGPWQAAGGQTEMRWTDTNASGRLNRFYRVKVVPP